MTKTNPPLEKRSEEVDSLLCNQSWYSNAVGLIWPNSSIDEWPWFAVFPNDYFNWVFFKWLIIYLRWSFYKRRTWKQTWLALVNLLEKANPNSIIQAHNEIQYINSVVYYRIRWSLPPSKWTQDCSVCVCVSKNPEAAYKCYLLGKKDGGTPLTLAFDKGSFFQKEKSPILPWS